MLLSCARRDEELHVLKFPFFPLCGIHGTLLDYIPKGASWDALRLSFCDQHLRFFANFLHLVFVGDTLAADWKGRKLA